MILGKFSAGVPWRRILTDLRQKTPKELDHIHDVECCDLHNIRKVCCIARLLQYDSIDLVSVESWIREKQNLGKKVSYYFTKTNMVIFKILRVFIMTAFQKNMLKLFFKCVHCIDGTHGLNDLSVSILLVSDKYDEGIPAAFAFQIKLRTSLIKFF